MCLSQFKTLNLGLVSLGLLIGANTVLAQTELEEVAVIGTRVEQDLASLASNISVLNSETLNEINAVHIQQALSQIPGVALQRGNGQESLPSIRSAVLTGAGACGNVLVMEEGIPVRGAGFCNVNELFDTHFEQAERIEVVRGAGSAYYGSNAVVGSINVVLPSNSRDRVSLEIGSFDYVRATAAVNYGFSESQTKGGRFLATLTDDGGYRDDAGFQQNKLSWRHRGSIGQWAYRAGLTHVDLDQETAGFVVGPDAYLDEQLARQNANPEAFRQSKSTRAWIKLNKELAQGRDLDLTVYARTTEMDFLQHFLPGGPLEQNEQTGFGWQSAHSIKVSPELNWTLGFDGDITDGELLQTQDAPTQGSAFLMATIPTGVHYDYQVDATQLAVFSHLDWQVKPSLKVLLGLRAERMEYDYDNRALDGRTRDDGTACGFGGCRYSRPADSRDSFKHVSPKLEIQYALSDALRLSFAVKDSFRAPQATELYRLQRAQTIADLDTAQASSVEANIEYLSEGFEFDLSVYQIKQRNLIIRDSDFFNIDGARTDSTGLELRLFKRFNSAWSVHLAATFADHEYASEQISGGININGLQVDTAPKRFGSATLKWEASPQWSTQLNANHVGPYFLDPENQNDYPGHTFYDLMTQYKINDHWSVSAQVRNLSDKRYAKRADFSSFQGLRYFPGEPRSLFAKIAYQF